MAEITGSPYPGVVRARAEAVVRVLARGDEVLARGKSVSSTTNGERDGSASESNGSGNDFSRTRASEHIRRLGAENGKARALIGGTIRCAEELVVGRGGDVDESGTLDARSSSVFTGIRSSICEVTHGVNDGGCGARQRSAAVLDGGDSHSPVVAAQREASIGLKKRQMHYHSLTYRETWCSWRHTRGIHCTCLSQPHQGQARRWHRRCPTRSRERSKHRGLRCSVHSLMSE